MEHLALEVFDLAEGKTSVTALGSKFANLPPNASITITDTSEIFASGDVWSFPFTLNVAANAHLFGTSGEIHGSRLHEQINKRRARLWVMGVPLYLGYLKLGDEVEVDENGDVDVSFESGQHTFDEMIEGAKANQVPMMSDVLIGMALWRKRWTRCRVKLRVSVTDKSGRVHSGNAVRNGDEWFDLVFDGEDEGSSVQQYPRMVFPKGEFRSSSLNSSNISINTLNTDLPYTEDKYGTPTNPYCNIALCYQKYGYEKKDDVGNIKPDYGSEPEAQRGYEYMPANRVNSAPSFFVIYWIRALMTHLGIHIEENQMMDVEDLRRLFFVNTNCAYIEPKELRNRADNERFGRFRFSGSGRLIPEYINSKRNVSIEESGLRGVSAKVIEGYLSDEDVSGEISIRISEVEELGDLDDWLYVTQNSLFFNAIATPECFPNVDIKEVISAIENGFGVRFLFDESYQRVRIVLLRNVFRDTEVQEIACEIVGDDVKVENSIRGFRMTYGDSEDTHFFYKGFDDKLPKKKPYFVDDSDKHDYSYWNLNTKYEELLDKVSAFDKTCYVDNATGDAYIIKVDKDAKRYDDLHQSLFEGAGFMDAEDGDCTGEDETIKAINVGFSPAIMNDVNYEAQRGENRTKNQKFALFVDETMRPRRPDLNDLPNEEKQPGVKSYDDADAVYNIDKLYELHGPSGSGVHMVSDSVVQPGSFSIKSDLYANITDLTADVRAKASPVYLNSKITFNAEGHINEGYCLYLQDNFEPNDDGVSPIETHDWGLTLGIMRGSGSDAYVNYSADPDDKEDNDTWDIVAGSNVTAHPDTCDNYGREWDYNGALHISTTLQAESEIRIRYPDTADAILSPRKTIVVQDLKDAGWEVSGDLTRLANYYYKLVIKSPSEGYVTVYATPIMLPTSRSYTGPIVYTREELKEYIVGLWNQYKFDLVFHDDLRFIFAVNPADWSTLAYLRAFYFGYASERDLDNGLGITDGRISLKLRAEKPNPYFDPTKEESAANRRYLEITNENLRGRGLCDQFYKEYSYWIRNARIVKRTVRMELAQLLTLDKTKRVTVGDVTGFIRKMQFSVDQQSGLGNVTMEIMYI